ncbi:MAG: carboxypeptidase regulatory-like domain-containing protein [Candidatus Sericytochromatia bacterium]|nr:carboxypeptidase regulatory-like domain-containing protein [Candidatus Tanganyikabacteria bacterium]
MRSSLRKVGLMAALAGMLLAGCGQSPVASFGSTASASKSGSVVGARDAEVGAETNMMNLNATGDLEDLTDEDILALDPTAEIGAADADQDLADEAKKKTPETVKVKTVTKCGFIRSNTDGKFFLQVSKGFLWWKRESSIPLSGADEDATLKLAKHLNKKVLVRGPLQGETIITKRVMGLLDFGAVWDLLSKGSLKGTAYDARTKVGLAHAEITVKSFATGRMWRTKTDTSGNYNVGRLDAGEYEVSAKSADYALGAKDKISVKKRSAAKVHLACQPEGSFGPATGTTK